MLVECSFLLHGIEHVNERVMSFFYLSSANWRQLELVILQNVGTSCVNFTTIFACKILLSLSIFDTRGPYNCSVKDHILVNMTLPNVSDWIESDLLKRRDIIQPDIKMFFEGQELTYVLFLSCYDFRLHGDEALFQELKKLFWILVKTRSFVREMIKKFKKINLDVIMELRVSFHDYFLDIVRVSVFQIGTDSNHKLFESILVFLHLLLLVG